MTPTARTLKYLRDLGHTAGVVERWNPHARIRQDLFGFIDLISVNGNVVNGWQATSASNMAARVTKIRESPLFPAVGAAMSIWVIGWRRVKVKRGGVAVRWEPRIVPVAPPTRAGEGEACGKCGHPFDHELLGKYGCPNCA